MLDLLFYFVGAAVIARLLIWDLGRELYKRLLRPAASLKRFGAKEGAWAGKFI